MPRVGIKTPNRASKLRRCFFYFVGAFLRLWIMCARTSWLLARAAMRLISPARTAPAMALDSAWALVPGALGAREAPATFMTSRQARCAGSDVPPPTVPTSRDGMVQDMSRPGSASPGMSIFSMSVMQLADSTTCAGSCPVARKAAATMLAAWALKPPTEPAMALPMRHFWRFASTMASTVVLSVLRTTSAVMVASTTTLLPRPSIQLMAAGFLSQQTLPEMATSSISGKCSSSSSMTLRQPLDTMFMPMASPAKQTQRR
mmetsp:Transcript_8019/g.22894  ORF Transcript_8019/g.22894 Transcript_8019/m.22894 type:complete len:260 (-) Transcript_8019:627-1406(-)